MNDNPLSYDIPEGTNQTKEVDIVGLDQMWIVYQITSNIEDNTDYSKCVHNEDISFYEDVTSEISIKVIIQHEDGYEMDLSERTQTFLNGIAEKMTTIN